MKRILYIFLFASILTAASSCVGDLDQYPPTESTAKDAYKDADSYQDVLSGIYAAFIQRIGNISTESRCQNWIRVMMMFQDASTDSVDAIWLAGESLTDVNGLSWTAADPWVSAAYYHIYNIVSMTNELIRNSDEGELAGFSEEDKERIRTYRNEARFLRAYAYLHAMDFYPKMSFITEKDPVGSYIPTVYDRKQMFSYIESELREIAGLLPETAYGHATSYAAWALLARAYLNAEVWTGDSYADECIEACKEVFKGSFTLEPDYKKLFNADNHLRSNEIIFAFACDAFRTTTWDATTFITCGSVLDNFIDYEAVYGTKESGAWNCLRARPELADAFQTGDTRNLTISYNRLAYSEYDAKKSEGYYARPGDETYIYQDRGKDIIGHDETTSGWRVSKWTNLTDAGEAASHCSDGGGANTDFPVLRLAEVKLTYAEALFRRDGAVPDAVDAVNDVRRRAFGSDAGNIASADLTEEFLMQERLRELYMEGLRRTDLIRFGKYTSGYQWQWKGGTAEGKDVHERYAFLPIPEAELSVNPAMKEINSELGF